MEFNEELTTAVLREIKERKYDRDQIAIFLEGIIFILYKLDKKNEK